MTSALLPPELIFRALDANGAPLAGGWLTFYAAGTNTLQAAYSDATGATPLANPLQLDANGQAAFWLKSGLIYKINLTDSTGTQQSDWPIDNITADQIPALLALLSSQASASPGAAMIGDILPGVGAVGMTQHQINLLGRITPETFGAVGDGVTDDTAAIQAAIVYAAGRPIYFKGVSYAVKTITGGYVLTLATNNRFVGVPGLTRILLTASPSNCYLLGSPNLVNTLVMEDIALDGNKATVGASSRGVFIPTVNTFVAIRCQFNNFRNDPANPGGDVSTGTGITAGNGADGSALVRYIKVQDSVFSACERNGIQTYHALRQVFENNHFLGFTHSPIDSNPLAPAGTENAATRLTIRGNVVECASPFAAGESVFSLLADDVECVGNKIKGGSVQIVAHARAGWGTTQILSHYTIADNFLWDADGYQSGVVTAVGVGIVANVDVNQDLVIRGNHVYRAKGSSILVTGLYAGAVTVASPGEVVVADNVVHDTLSSTAWDYAFHAPSAIHFQGVSNFTCTGNVVYAPRYAGIRASGDCANGIIADNVITGHKGQRTTTDISTDVLGAKATFSGSVMTVTQAPTSGSFAVGQLVRSAGVADGTTIASYGTGSGGLGTYNLSTSPGTITPAQDVTAQVATPTCGGAIFVDAEGMIAGAGPLHIHHNMINGYMQSSGGNFPYIRSGGLVVNGLTGTLTKGLLIDHNTVTNGAGHGIVLYQVDSSVVQDNTVNTFPTSCLAIKVDKGSLASDTNTWVNALNLPRSGVTASRPLLAAGVPKGFAYFDTTLNKPVWYSGGTTVWWDATGTSV